MACCKGDYSLYNRSVGGGVHVLTKAASRHTTTSCGCMLPPACRILAGWVPGSERVTLGLADSAGTSGAVTRRYTLWPYDRPESKGQLKGVTLRIEDSKVLVLGYRWVGETQTQQHCHWLGYTTNNPTHPRIVCRSLPFWQDVRIKTGSSSSSTGKPHAPEHMRDDLQGLSVEYAKRSTDYWGEGGAPHTDTHTRQSVGWLAHQQCHTPASSPACLPAWLPAGSSSWSARGLLDFNMAFARYPSALPRTPGSFPPDPPGAAFTLLREGDAWLDAEHNLLLAVERLVPCEGANSYSYSYSVHNFYGFRGENPGQEEVRRADYSGYAAPMRCMQLRLVTGVAAAPGTLAVKLRLQGLDDRNRLVLGGKQVRAVTHSSETVCAWCQAALCLNQPLCVPSCLQCGFPVRPRLRVELPPGTDVLSIVWRNNLNQTVAVDAREVELPPLQPLDEASASNTEQCNTGCDWRYHVSVKHCLWWWCNRTMSQCAAKTDAKAASRTHALSGVPPSVCVCVQVKVLAADGSQTEVSVSVGSVSLSTLSLTATYRHYLASSILTAVEYQAVPVLPLTGTRPGAAEGRALLQQAVSLQAAATQVSSRWTCAYEFY